MGGPALQQEFVPHLFAVLQFLCVFIRWQELLVSLASVQTPYMNDSA